MLNFKTAKFFVIFLLAIFTFLNQGFCQDGPKKVRKGAQSLLLMPESMAQLIATHTLEMERRNFFQELSNEDFFHGHFISRDSRDLVQFDKDLFESVSLILYHTAEYNSRWEKEGRQGLAPGQRNPRSLVGWPNGQVQKAVDLIELDELRPGKLKTYNNAGTIYAKDIVEQNPQLSNLNYSKSSDDRMRKVSVSFLDGVFDLYTAEMFIILPSREGRFKLSNGMAFEVYIDVRNIKRRIGYASEDKFGPIINPMRENFPY